MPDRLHNATGALQWHQYACYGCGLLLELRIATASAAPTLSCPCGCAGTMTHRGCWPADDGGYGSTADREHT